MKLSLTKYADAEPEILPALHHKTETAISLPAAVSEQTAQQLTRMFRDPRVLEPAERTDLIDSLRQAVELCPQAAEVKVLLGMALSVDLQAQESLTVLRTAAEQDPHSFIAQLKLGELLMRLRVCSEAEEVTLRAARLATNTAQSEMARRQAAIIRSLLRSGVERGGFVKFFDALSRIPFRLFHRTSETALAAAK